MKILGFEIKRINSNPLPEDKNFEDFVTNCLTQCNNQLRGVINEKAKQYNLEILEYYFAEVMKESINFGIALEKESNLNEKINNGK